MSNWITTKQAMQLLGVGSTTVKRWADQGVLPFYRTAGGHRRFRRSAIEEIASGQPAPGYAYEDEALRRWFEILSNSDVCAITGHAERLPEEHDDWFGAADFLGAVARFVGDLWADEHCSIVASSMLSAKLRQAVSTLATSIRLPDDARSALVVTVGGEHHTAGALLAQLCLRQAGFGAAVLSDGVAPEHLADYLRRSEHCLLALSASSWQTDHTSLRHYYRNLAVTCQQEAIALVLGGSGAWPAAVEYGDRCHSFKDLRSALSLINPVARRSAA